MASNLVDRIGALLPQTQCTQCGYGGCAPYAEAIARGEAQINRCPPGGAALIARLAELIGREPLLLDAACGAEQPRMAASIEESVCIGCTLCMRVCPPDAIVGAPGQMHTVLTEACTGCGLCAPACPVDCIEILPMSELAARGSPMAAAEAGVPVAARAERWRARVAARDARLARSRTDVVAQRAGPSKSSRAARASQRSATRQRKRRAIEAALARARARRNSPPARDP